MAVKIQIRGGTAAAWVTANPILAEREIAVETDTLKLKIGDGSTAWNSLDYIAGGDDHFKGVYLDDSALSTAHPTADAGDYAYVDAGVGNPVELWMWDDDDSEWVQGGTGGVVPPASPTTAGVAKLYANLSASNTDGAPDQASVVTGLNGKQDFLPTTRSLTSDHTLDSTDMANAATGKKIILLLDSAIAINLTMPTNASLAIPIGTTYGWRQQGAGQVTFVPPGGGTLRSPNNANKSYTQYSEGYIRKVNTNEWLLGGDITV